MFIRQMSYIHAMPPHRDSYTACARCSPGKCHTHTLAFQHIFRLRPPFIHDCLFFSNFTQNAWPKHEISTFFRDLPDWLVLLRFWMRSVWETDVSVMSLLYLKLREKFSLLLPKGGGSFRKNLWSESLCNRSICIHERRTRVVKWALYLPTHVNRGLNETLLTFIAKITFLDMSKNKVFNDLHTFHIRV